MGILRCVGWWVCLLLEEGEGGEIRGGGGKLMEIVDR